jgi:tetratricopeptide (TPR) repeat protein
MPSLNALGQFKYSFNNIAKEKADIESLKLPFDDFALPTTEAPPFEFIRQETPAFDVSDFDEGGGGVDITSFLDNISDGDTPPPVDVPADNAISALDDFLKGLSPGGAEEPTDTGADSFDTSSLTGGQDEGMPDVSGADDLSSFLGGGQDEGASEETDAGGFDLSSLTGGQDETPPEDTNIDNFDMSSLTGGQDETPPEDTSIDNFDMSSLTGGQDETPPEDTAIDNFDLSSLGGGQDETTPLADEGAIPDDLLSGFSDEVESAPADSEMPDFGDVDFGTPEESVSAEAKPQETVSDDFAGIDLGGESQDSKPTVAAAESDDFGGIDLGGESQDSMPSTSADSDASFGDIDFNVDALGSDAPDSFEMPEPKPAKQTKEAPAEIQDSNEGIDLGGESPDFMPELAGGEDFSSDELPNMDFSVGDASEADFSGTGDSVLDTNFDIPSADADFSGAGDSALAGSTAFDTGADSGSAHDFGDLGADFATDSIELETGGGGASSEEDGDSGYSGDVFGGGDDDFSLSGLDDILNKTKVSAPKPMQKKGLFGRKKRREKEEEEIKAEDNIDEISLSQEDVNNLLHSLSSYPLNLRIACEELIAEQVILPEQLSKLIRLLVNGASVRETAVLVEEITGKPVVIPKSFEKSSGAAFEAEQSSFAYIFVHNLLPVLKLFAFIALMLGSVLYLSYKFIYTPLKAESIYKRGYERIPVGEYQRANELFHEAFTLHRKKKWFYAYAEAFRDQRRYMLAENKYDELLRYYPRDKKGVLDYAALNTYYLMNYDKANRLLQRELLDYAPNDFQGLLAAGDNFLDWADSNPAKFYDRYEDARFSYARLLEKYGWQPPVVERMMKYFIRTDNLKETLILRVWFENDPKKRKLSSSSLAELGGYLLDKQLIKTPGVPDPYIESIESVRNMLLQAVMGDPNLPEPHYHLARYHHNLGNIHEERLTIENAIRAFDLAKQESVKRRLYRVDAHYRYANLLINNKEFFPADEQAVRGIELFEDFLSRNLIPATPQLGQLYAVRGDLEYFVKSGNMEAALTNYKKAEGYGYAPPEVQYRMGAAYYQREDWRNALEYLFKASKELPLNRRLLFAMGNAAYQRGDYFAAQGYYDRLLDILETQRIRLPVLMPNDNIQFLETGERLMMARNNAGVVNEALAQQTGKRDYRSKAMVLYAESSRAWDAITRNPESMTRSRLTDSPGAPSINLGYLNANNALRPNSGYRPQIFVRIDKDALEPSKWEELAPMGGL